MIWVTFSTSAVQLLSLRFNTEDVIFTTNTTTYRKLGNEYHLYALLNNPQPTNIGFYDVERASLRYFLNA